MKTVEIHVRKKLLKCWKLRCRSFLIINLYRMACMASYFLKFYRTTSKLNEVMY